MLAEQKQKLKDLVNEIAKEEDLGFGEIQIRIQDFKAVFIRTTKEERVS